MAKGNMLKKNNKNTKKPRILLNTCYDEKERKHIVEKRKYVLKLTQTEVAILKAALKYWLLDHKFGYALWDIESGNFSPSDYAYLHIILGSPKAEGLYGVIDRLCKVGPDFGYWGDLDRLTKLCKKEFEKFKDKAHKFEEEYGIDYWLGNSLSGEDLEQIKQEKEVKL